MAPSTVSERTRYPKKQRMVCWLVKADWKILAEKKKSQFSFDTNSAWLGGKLHKTLQLYFFAEPFRAKMWEQKQNKKPNLTKPNQSKPN